MRTFQQIVAILICVALPSVSLAADSPVGYVVKYSGGSLQTVKGGEDLKLFVGDTVRLMKGKSEVLSIQASSITEVSYGQEVHRRIGTAVGLAVLSLGIGILVAFSKSKKHYIGVIWAEGDKKGGIALQADKDEYRGLLTALEGVTGKKAIDTDAPTEAAAKSGVPISATAPAPSPQSVSAPSSVQPTPPPTAAAPISTAPEPTIAPISVNVAKVPPHAESSRSSPPNAAPAISGRAEPIRDTPNPGPALPASPRPTEVPVSGLVDVTFASNPPGAFVYFNKALYTARSPFVTKLMPGKYTVKFTLAGYPDWEAEITVDAAKPSTVVAQLGLSTGLLLK